LTDDPNDGNEHPQITANRSGAVFALKELNTLPTGFYTFEALLLQKMRQELLKP
jgi:hypothetical protein